MNAIPRRCPHGQCGTWTQEWFRQKSEGGRAPAGTGRGDRFRGRPRERGVMWTGCRIRNVAEQRARGRRSYTQPLYRGASSNRHGKSSNRRGRRDSPANPCIAPRRIGKRLRRRAAMKPPRRRSGRAILRRVNACTKIGDRWLRNNAGMNICLPAPAFPQIHDRSPRTESKREIVYLHTVLAPEIDNGYCSHEFVTHVNDKPVEDLSGFIRMIEQSNRWVKIQFASQGIVIIDKEKAEQVDAEILTTYQILSDRQ
jgi:hypothetical protein